MKHIIVAIALLAASTMPVLAGEATASTAPQLDRTQEYRMWSAEQMLERVTTRLSRMTAACNNTTLRTYLPKVSESCKESVIGLYPQLRTIREIAASGDEVMWAKVIDIVHELERDTEPNMQTLERK